MQAMLFGGYRESQGDKKEIAIRNLDTPPELLKQFIHYLYGKPTGGSIIATGISGLVYCIAA